MTKVTLSDLDNLTSPTAISTINSNSATIETAFDNTLSRDGTSPNTMGSSLDMNSNRILNLPSPSANTEPVRLGDLSNTSIFSYGNPSATVGLTAKNGTASTVLRADSAPALDQSIAPTWTGTHTFTPATGLNKAFKITQSGSGAPTLDGGVDGFGWGFNIIKATDTGIDTSAAASGSQNQAALYVEYLTNTTGGKGNIASIYGATKVNVAPATSDPNLLNFVGILANSLGSVNVGGSSGTPLGALFGAGIEVNLSSGATHYANLTGLEIDAAIQTGASSVRYSVLSLATYNNHAVSGSTYDTVLSISGNGNTIGTNSGILFSDYNGAFPVKSTGTLIKTQGSSTVSVGIDMSSFSFTGAYMAFPAFKIYSSGLPHVQYSNAFVAGGSLAQGIVFGNTTSPFFGMFCGSGAPTITAYKGSLYLRTDGSGTSNRAYINTDGGTTWTAITTAA